MEIFDVYVFQNAKEHIVQEPRNAFERVRAARADRPQNTIPWSVGLHRGDQFCYLPLHATRCGKRNVRDPKRNQARNLAA